jgi:hypothetical protein
LTQAARVFRRELTHVRTSSWPTQGASDVFLKKPNI